MKVLQINSVCGYGSTGKIAVDLYHELEERGIDCCIAYGRGRAPKDIKSIKIGNKLDFYYHALMTRLFDKHAFASKRATKKFIKQMRLYDPDIIHLHNIHGYYINIEILFECLKEINKPVIWTLHDCWSFTGHCAHFEPVNCGKWKNLCGQCPLKRDYPQSCFGDSSEMNYVRKRDAITGIKNLTIVTPSKWLASRVKQSFLKNYRVEIIPNGINNQIFHSLNEKQIIEEKLRLTRKYRIDFSKKIFLGVSSVWTKDKGFEDFISMAKKLPENVQIVLVGVDKRQKKSLPSNVIAIERTENQCELASLYACADVFLNPTYADTFPTVNMEAKSCGLPVITYKTGGSVEIADMTVVKGNWNEMMRLAQKFNLDKYEKVDDNYFANEKNIQRYINLIEEQLKK